ncbi:DMT family transporter [Microvirga puerhi]|uniref:EamA family transporter n=1 Tax=Microvirga puerhi TaxID=2876078 RepID=A0ABS7VTH6_9HYPH|nr:EamA family transporter [Microvirga puerhi]MBZ6078866.1 EamA family transporter [Microvirga puerhi]
MRDRSSVLLPHFTLCSILAWGGLIVSETLAQVALKAAGDRLGSMDFGVGWVMSAITDPWTVAGVIGYVGAFASWMTVLNRIPLSLGFPLTSVIYVTVTAASVLLFREEFGVLRWSGIMLIVVGVVIIGTEED